MELASQESIADLLQGVAQARAARSPRGGGRSVAAGQSGNRATARRTPRCRCGRCRQCADDARWERIFVEKFADPDYYTRRHVPSSSPLESL
jgi:hypothetical protein